MNRSGWRPRLAALLTALLAGVGLLSLSSLPALATGGSITEFPIKTTGSDPLGITSGPDGNLWFTEGAADTTDTIGRLTPAGSFTAFPLPTDGSDGSRPRSITAGPDGNLWFTEELAGEIGRITTS